MLDARFGGDDNSYRAFRFRWTGRPLEPPAVVVRGGRAYISWNGATAVARWRLLAGSAAGGLHPVDTAARHGFETSLAVPKDTRYVAVEALDERGRVLRKSETAREH